MIKNELVSDAVVVWAGWGKSPFPTRDLKSLVTEYGNEIGQRLIIQIHELENSFYSSNARFEAPNLVDMGEQAATEFRTKHPEISEDAVKAFAWCYTYDFK